MGNQYVEAQFFTVGFACQKFLRLQFMSLLQLFRSFIEKYLSFGELTFMRQFQGFLQSALASPAKDMISNAVFSVFIINHPFNIRELI